MGMASIFMASIAPEAIGITTSAMLPSAAQLAATASMAGASYLPTALNAANLLNSGGGAADPLMSGIQAGTSLANGVGSLPSASGFNPASYLQNSGLGGALPATEAAAPIINPNQGILDAIQRAPVSPITDAATQITPMVNAAPESTYNLASRFPGESTRQFPNFQNGQISENLANAAQQQRINAPSLPPVESITAPPASAPVSTSATAPADGTILPEDANKINAKFQEDTQKYVDKMEAERAAEPRPYIESVPQTDYQKYSELTDNNKGVDTSNLIKGQSTWGDTKALFAKPNWNNIKAFANEHPYLTGIAGLGAYQLLKPSTPKPKETISHIRPYTNTRTVSPTASYYTPYSGASTAERNYFTGGLQALPIYRAAEGGLTSFAVGGPIETMSAMNAVGENLGYPQSQYQTDIYSNPNVQRPQAMDMIAPSGDVSVDPYTGEQKFGVGGLSGNAGTELSKMMSTGSKDTGEYKYSYDPVTQQFTQLNDPVADAAQKATAQMGNIGGGGLGSIYQTQNTPKVAPKPFVPIVTGGLAQPAIQPEAQPMQQAPAPAPIPAYQTPEQQLGLGGFYDYMNQQLGGMRGYQGFAEGGLSHLGGYSDGGRLLRGPGDGVSDSIPASIGDRQPARLADGEFVVPARIVSEIGNGSTEAGARKLYAMMERVQSARKKSVGKGKVAVNSKADRLLPA